MAYFIGKTTRKNIRGEPIYALYQKPLNGEREELIANVNQLTLRYGVSLPNSHDIFVYQPSTEVRDWRRVRSVELILQLSSEDHRHHRLWHLYAALRERP